MSAHRQVFASLVLGCAGCSVSHYARSADTHLENWDYAQALADYRAALQTERLAAAQREAVAARLAAAAAQAARHELRVADERTERGDIDGAVQVLWGILRRNDAWSAPAEQATAADRLAGLVAVAWPEVEGHAAAGRFIPAVGRALQLLAPLPAEHPLRTALVTLRRRARDYHLDAAQRAAQHSAPLTLFHRRMAALFGGEAQPPGPPDFAPAPLPWRLTAAPGPCAWAAARLAERYRGGPQARATARLALDTCEVESKDSTEAKPCTFPDWQPYRETVLAPTGTAAAAPCDAGACSATDRLGVCLRYARPCAEPDAPQSGHGERREIVRYRAIDREATCTTHRVRLSARLRGQLTVTYLGSERRVPIDIVQVHEDEAFWSPRAHKHFAIAAVARGEGERYAEERAVDAIQVELDHAAAAIRDTVVVPKLAAAALQLDTAAGRGEALLALAQLGADRVDTTTAQRLRDHFDLAPDAIVALLRGELDPWLVVPPAELLLPEATPGVAAAIYELEPVVNESEITGFALMTRAGIDIGLSIQSSPLHTADFLAGVDIALRSESFTLAVGGQSAHIGGEAEGFYVDWRALFEVGPIYLAVGIAYSQQISTRREHYTNLSIPLAVYQHLTPWLVVDIELNPNTFMLKEWIDPDSTDPHFYSPISIGATLNLGQRFYARARAIHYLGISTAEPIHFYGGLGARL